jgi:hypothetical protein
MKPTAPLRNKFGRSPRHRAVAYLFLVKTVVIVPIRSRLTQTPLQRGHVANFTSAAPGESEPGAAVAVVVNDDAAVAKFFALKANA